MRQVIRQWKEHSDGMHSNLYDMYNVMYAVVFDTAMCFAIMNDSVITHRFNGFEVEFDMMSPKQKALLSTVIDTAKYSVANCPFVKNVSMTNVVDEEPSAPWCDCELVFAVFMDEELATAKSFEDLVTRADTFGVVLQEILNRGNSCDPAHNNFIVRSLECLTVQLSGGLNDSNRVRGQGMLLRALDF